MKILFNIFSIFYLWEHTQRVWYKNLWNWHVNDIWPRPKVTSLTIRWKCYLHSVLLVISVDLICHMTMFEIFFDPWAPQCPKVPPLGHDSCDRMKIPSDMFCIFHLWEHTYFFWIKIFEIDFVIEIKWYLTFWPLPRDPGGGAKEKLTLRAPFMWVTHTPNLVGFRPMV